MKQRMQARELLTIGDACELGAFEWGDLVNPPNLIVDLEEEFPWLYEHWHPGQAEPGPPPFPMWAVATVGGVVLVGLVSWLVLRKPRTNPRRRRRRRKKP